MKTLLAAVCLTALAASSFGQNQTLMVDTNFTVVQTNTNPLVFRSPIGFGTNTSFQAQSRTNLGLTAIGEILATATNALDAQNAIGISSTNTLEVGGIDIQSFGSSGVTGFVGRTGGGVLALKGTNVSTATPAVFGYTGFETGIISAANIRTAAGLTLSALTNTTAANFQGALFSATNAAPTNTNAPTPDAWVDITVGTNVFKLPLWQ